MSYLFYDINGAYSFNDDIGAWDTSGVTTMERMFHYARAFNRDIGGWAVNSLTSMYQMFFRASDFDQDLGWCVDESDGVDMHGAFDETPCKATSCGVTEFVYQADCDVPSTGSVMVNWKIKKAIMAWLSDASAAEATYGHISNWGC